MTDIGQIVERINPNELPVGAELEVRTKYCIYTLRILEDGMTIQGGSRYPEPVPFVYHVAFGKGMTDELFPGQSMVGVVSDRKKPYDFTTSAIKKMILRGPQ